jgi:demethylmenaquinone methyltransferase/2-methoxy-6-polyprenyl-1,4-benzoquinol methylase
MSKVEKTTNFGYEQVTEGEKVGRVRDVFDSVAERYDLMNDLMSLGVHRLWKWFAITQGGVKEGDIVLDVAAGSGDLSRSFAERAGPSGRVVVTDINKAMIEEGRRRLADAGVIGNLDFVQADAERLPFVKNHFDCICIGFGLRNVTRKAAALESLYECLRPGGRLLVLEFSKPVTPLLEKLYDAWSFNIIPRLGAAITGDRDSYTYLVESIRVHPGQEELKEMLRSAGFDEVRYHNLSGGIVALHVGYKY